MDMDKAFITKIFKTAEHDSKELMQSEYTVRKWLNKLYFFHRMKRCFMITFLGTFGALT